MKQPFELFRNREREVFLGAIEKTIEKTQRAITRTNLPAEALRALLVVALGLLLCQESFGTPFNGEIRFTQPNGVLIHLRGQGDEFHAVFETLEGYTVVFVPERRAYFYARLSADATTLESTGAMAGRDDPNSLGLAPHLRIAPEAARAQALQKYEVWDKATGLSQRWAALKAQTLRTGSHPLAPPTFQTKGTKCGLTVLVDFEDERAEIPQEEIEQFLNGDHYTGFGNNGSVKQYFWDNSNGALTYTNVVIPYITIPNSLHPRSYYNDVTLDAGTCNARLIRDALKVMKSLPNFTNDILPLLQAVTVDANHEAVAANFLVAGADSGVGSAGLSPYQDKLAYYVGVQQLWPMGNKVNIFQLTTMNWAGQTLGLGAFCHENGHMLCGFPDLYDYGSDSVGGTGYFCLMGQGSVFATSPCQVCAYLKLAAGWATAIDVPVGTNLTASLSATGSNMNRFLRLRKPGTPTEYFLIENRQRSGHDRELPGAGVAIWHIDELGSHDNQSMKTNSNHANYEATLVQADNRWDLEYYYNKGDAEDLFYAGNPARGYANAFSDFTSPSANWWNGTRSGLELTDFSSNAETMSLNARVEATPISVDPRDVTVFEGQTATLGFSLASSTQVSAIQWWHNGAPISSDPRFFGIATNSLVISQTQFADSGQYAAVLTHSFGAETSRVAQLTVLAGPPLVSTNLGAGGATTLLPDGLDLSSSGIGISGNRDNFRFACQPVSGDFDVTVRLLRIDMNTLVSLAGLMVREKIGQTSRHFSVLLGTFPYSLPCSVVMRSSEGGASREVLGFNADASTYTGYFTDSGSETVCPRLRLKREGDRFTAFGSFDGSKWVFLKSVYLELKADVFVGMAVTAGLGASGQATASFRNYQLQTNAPTALAAFTLDPVAQEGTLDAAHVVIQASRNGPLTAKVRFEGTATFGADYLPLPSEVFIPAGTNVGILTITAMNDALAEWPETVEVALEAQPGLEVAQPATAKVLILDGDRTAGGLRRRVYPGIGNWDVADLTRQMTNRDAVTDIGYVTSFETPSNYANFYGQVLEGYLIPPETGNYTFYLAAYYSSELWLGTSANPTSARLVAQVTSRTPYRDYSGSLNHSAALPLTAGQYYYVKALHKSWSGDDSAWAREHSEWAGHDWFSVAWRTPSGVAPTNGSNPIDGKFLAFSLPLTNGISLTPPAAVFSALAATGSVQVTCAGGWTVQSLDAWITPLRDTNGAGSGTVTYALSPNRSGITRDGTIVINGATHSVIQEAAPALRCLTAVDGALELVVEYLTPLTLVIEASDDLLAWTPISTNATPVKLILRDIDPLVAIRSVRFYRAVAQP